MVEPPPALPAKLPIYEQDLTILSGWRVHRTVHHPVFFGPPPGAPPTNRFDAPNGEYRVLYLGETFAAAFIETMLRVPRQPTVELATLLTRSASRLESEHLLRLVDLRGPGLSAIGADNRLTTTLDYALTGQWALALWRHPDAADGILYRSRHDPHHVCAAIFDRAGGFRVQETVELKDLARRWAPILRAHGKGLS